MPDHGDILQLMVVFLSEAEGCRRSTPSLKGGWYRPHLVVPPDTEMLGVQFVDGPEEHVVTGQPIVATVRLVYSGVSYASLRPGAEFLICEGSRTVGRGHVIDVLPAIVAVQP